MDRLQCHKKKDKRLAAILALAYIVLIFVMYMQSPKQAAYSASRYVRYTVQGGDTLWNIAKTRSGNRDIRAVVWELQEVNGITPVIRPGQVIWVPEVPNRFYEGRDESD